MKALGRNVASGGFVLAGLFGGDFSDRLFSLFGQLCEVGSVVSVPGKVVYEKAG